MSDKIEKKVTELAQELIKGRDSVSVLQSEIKSNKELIKAFVEREDEIIKELGVRFSDEDFDT